MSQTWRERIGIFGQFPRLDGDDTGRYASVHCPIARTQRTQAALAWSASRGERDDQRLAGLIF